MSGGVEQICVEESGAPSPSPDGGGVNTKPVSQAGMILERMRSGKAVTSLEAYLDFGCLNLKGRIYDIRHGACPEARLEPRERIETEFVRTATGKTVASYWISVAAEAGAEEVAE